MKPTLMPIVMLLVLALTACGGGKRENHSVTVGYINWRTSVIDTVAADSVDALEVDSVTRIAFKKPEVKIFKVNPFTTIRSYVKYYFEAPDSLVATDSLALARPELADSIKESYSSDDREAYINRKMEVDSAESLFGSSLIIVISAFVLLIFLILKIHKVFIRSPFKDDEED